MPRPNPGAAWVRDELIGAAVARQGGYEVIERNGKWVSVANALGLRSEMAYDVKEKYEEMLRQAAAELEDEDEDEEYEVEEILDAPMRRATSSTSSNGSSRGRTMR
jgi:hypothetical protein